ncbi:MAG: M20/M25/M40 family metallo-hydrolase [Acidobacteriota bacterium]|nr:M20/M25/M40 family metallo-hydrolase [Acidobacteriota bacterium]
MFSKISSGSRRRLLLPLFAVSLAASAVLAQQRAADPDVPDVERLRAYITYLASDKLEGRRTGTPGAEEAARYVAAEFKRLGLAPGVTSSITFWSGPNELGGAGRGYFQRFPYVAGVELGKNNSLTVTRRVVEPSQGVPLAIDFVLGEDWMPLGFSANGKVESAPVVFVGYGITDAEQNYDDYKGADLKGKVALAFAGTPDGDNPHGRFTRSGELRFKAAAARAAGASALAVIAREEKFKDDRLAALKYDNAGGDAGLPVVAVSRQAASKILGTGGVAQLAAIEKAVLAWGGTTHTEPTAGDWLTRLKLRAPEGIALSVATDVVRKEGPAANVVGVLEGSDPKLRDEVIVVGAHYDHLGRGGEGSLAPREGEIHHGADDNASGTAGLLELARLLSRDREKMRRTLVFIAFGGEEEGLIGSSYYVAHPARPVEQTVAMINMDMIGRLKGDALTVGGVGTAAEWRGWVEEANRGYRVSVDPMVVGAQPNGNAGGGGPARQGTADKTKGTPDGAKDSNGAKEAKGAKTGKDSKNEKDSTPFIITGTDGRVVATATPGPVFTLRLNEDGYGPSDHSSFYSKKVPVLFLFTGAHEDYHKPSDTADKINYEGEARVLQFAREIVYDLQAAARRPTFAVARTEGASRSTGFRVYLGTIPTYADSSDGLRLDGVREGSPAEKAGLKAGDRVVKLAGRDVKNVYDYTQALSEMKAGQEYEVEVVREGQRLTLKITPAVRK